MSRRLEYSIAEKLILEKIEYINKEHNLDLNFVGVKDNWIGSGSRILLFCNIHKITIDVSYRNFIRLEKYGCPECAIKKQHESQGRTTEEFIKLSKEKYGDKFTYEKTNYVTARKKVIITCKEHGDFLVGPDYHLRESTIAGGCPECKRNVYYELNKRPVEEFIEKARAVHGDKYDYSKVNYVNNITPIIIICPIHGEFSQLPTTHLRGFGCHKCNCSIGETILIDYFSEHEITPLHHMVIHYSDHTIIPDFLIELNDKQYMIEYNGIQHYNPNNYFNSLNNKNSSLQGFEYQKNRDELKIKYCNENNLILIIVPYILDKKEKIYDYMDKVLYEGIPPNSLIDFDSLYVT